MTDYVLTGLVKRRSALAGEIEATHETLRKMVGDLESLDATILQFDPTHQVEAIKPKAFRPPRDWANRGEMSRMVLSTLRLASEPLTTRDIAAANQHLQDRRAGHRGKHPKQGSARDVYCGLSGPMPNSNWDSRDKTVGAGGTGRIIPDCCL